MGAVNRKEKLLDLAVEIANARALVTELETQFDALLGGGSVEAEVAKQEKKPRPTNGAGKGPSSRAPSPLRDQVVALAREGLGRSEIAEKLGLKGRQGLVQVGNQIYRAKQAGQLPKE